MMSPMSRFQGTSRREFLRLSGIGAAGLALAACAPVASPPQSSATSESDTAAAPAEDGKTSVTVNHASWAGPMANQVHYTQRIFLDRLFDQVSDGSLMPSLAERWEWAPDATAVTFYLRQGVVFHDDTPFTAQDVATSIKAAVSPHLGGRFARLQPLAGVEAYANDEADDIEGLEIVDDHTITLHFDRPAAGFFAYSAFGRDGLNIVPAHIWDPAIAQAKAGEISLKESQNPWYWSEEACIGTGPFRYVAGQQEQYVRLAKVENSWRGVPQIDELMFQNFGGADTQVLAFEKGELDILSVQPDYFEQVSSLADVTVDTFATPYIQILSVNCEANGIGIAERNVRHAVSSAINRAAINTGLYKGYHEPWTAVLQGEWNDESIEQYPYDPDMARQLLAEAGYNAEEVILGWDYPDNLPRQLMEAIQANLQEVGINASLFHAQDAAAQEAQTAGRYSFWLDAYAAHYSPFAIANHHRKAFQDSRGKCGSDEIESLLDQAEATADPDAQKKIWSSLQATIQENGIVIPLWRRGARVVYRNRVAGWDNNSTAAFAMFGFHQFSAENWQIVS